MLGLTTTLTEVDEKGNALENPPFQIVADSAGVKLTGESRRLTNMDELQEMAQAFDRAWRLHLTYKPKITNLAGH